MKKNILLTLLVNVGVCLGVCAQTPMPNAETDQYFCSENAWALIGEDRDYLSDLQIFPDVVGWSISWYEDAAMTTPITNPESEALLDGTTYYVTQTDDQGNESAPLEITVVENDCACIKDPAFEDQNGNPSARGYEFLQFLGIQNHKTCAQVMTGADSFTLGPVDSPYSSSEYANLVTPGQVFDFINSGGTNLAAQYQVSLPRTNPDNLSSSHALLLNKGAEYGGPSAGTNISAVQKDFVAGEVFSFNFSLFIQNPESHSIETRPFAQIRLYDQNGNVVRERCLQADADDCVFNEAGSGSSQVLYPGWTCLKFNTSDFQGQALTMEVVTAFCTPQQHFTTIYVDDIYVGDDGPDICGDSAFGYASIEDVSGGDNSCYIVADDVNGGTSCGVSAGDRQIPGFPLEVCGVYDAPISTGNPATIDQIALNIMKNNVVVGTVTNPVQGNAPNEFCFTVNASDVNVIPYGDFTFDLDVNFVLDCGSPYNFEISDNTSYDLCPTTGCPSPLVVCDATGNGVGTFDLTEADAVIRDQWAAGDLDISYYEDQDLALEGVTGEIADPENYNNVISYNQTIYARIDWNPSGTTGSNCSYLVELPLVVNELPVLDIEDNLTICGTGGQVSVIATPTNLGNLTDVNYLWYREGSQLPTTGSYMQIDRAGEYTVTVSEANCEVSKTFNVEIIDLEVSFDDDPMYICDDSSGGGLTLSPTIVDNSPTPIDVSQLQYTWNNGETTDAITVTQSGTYSVEVTYGSCVESASTSVFISVQPEVSLGEDVIVCSGENSQIIANVSNFQDTSSLEFVWERDGSLISGETSATLENVTEEGLYTVSVYDAVNPDCLGTDEMQFSFYANENCAITEGLSPDTTPGQNDCLDLAFLADRTGIRNIQLFNRYGRLVFEENNYIDSFCGQDKDGDMLPTGTYYYVLDLAAEDPVFGTSKKGWIYINREAN